MQSLAFHHLGILVADITKAVEIYSTRFGYVVDGDLVHDPVQTAYIQLMTQADSASTLELVAPDGPQSKLTNALKRGGGLNHLCYQTSELDEDCRRLRDQGMLLLHPPVPAEAFGGRRIAWLMGRDGIPVELLEDPRP
ncbi:MAG: VOC family protein [Planctomycetaceae bacterium]|nr:VOC family protein [Planctomycetaceae bacterium]